MSFAFSRSSFLSSAVATTLFSKAKSSLRVFSYAVLLIALFLPFQAYAEPKGSPQTVNINTASAEKLALVLDGVGMAKAIAIVEHRKRYGNFKQIESVESVKGIGSSTLEKNRSKIVIK